MGTGDFAFVFTDIEGSTRLARQLGDGYGELLRQHSRLMRECFAEHGLRAVTEMGDGFFFVGPDAGAAVAACAAAQDRLQSTTWPDGAHVAVRMGVHHGPATETEGSYVGVAIHQAARVGAAAHGGQILVTAGVADAVQRSAAAFGTEPLGRYRLKDFADPIELLAVLQPGQDRGPAPRATPAAAHNVPVLRTALIGREGDLAALAGLLRDPGALVTLVGPGGVGKTRVAFETVKALAEGFPDGAWVGLLASVTGAADLEGHLLTVLGLREQPGLRARDLILDHLGDRRLLLTLDNCEHLIDVVADLVDSVLARCPHVSVLATSREPLQLPGERVWRVEPLETSAENGPPAAVELFVERASFANPRLERDELRHREDVASLCAALDGLPLAIELAAARTRHLSVAELRGSLAGSLGPLQAGRGVDARHRTLTATIEWSYRLLDDSTRQVFRRLSTFRSSFDAADAAPVAGAGDVSLALAELADKSLLVTEVADTTRYRMLVTIRQYAFERLTESPEECTAAQARHARWAMETAREIADGLSGMQVEASLERATQHQSNFVAALDYSYTHAMPDVCAATVLHLFPYWFASGHLDEGRQWLLLVAESSVDAVQSGLASVYAGWLTYLTGRVEEATGLCERGVGQLVRTEDEAALLRAAPWFGNVLAYTGRHSEAEPWFERVARSGDPRHRGSGHNGLGMLAYFRGDYDAALRHYRDALTQHEAVGQLRNAQIARFNIAESLVALGETAEARPMLEQVLEERLTVTRPYLPMVYELLADIAQQQGDPDRAAELLETAAAVAMEVGARGYVRKTNR